MSEYKIGTLGCYAVRKLGALEVSDIRRRHVAAVRLLILLPFRKSEFLTDAQTDVQDVPVDGDLLIRRLAVLLIYQCMSVPTSGTTILSGHHFPRFKVRGPWFK